MTYADLPLGALRALLASTADCEATADIVLEIVGRGEHLDDSELGAIQRSLDVAPDTAQDALARAYVLATPFDRLPTVAHELLHDKRDLVRDATAHALAELGRPALPTMRLLLEDKDREVRWYATVALARDHRENAIALLVDQLGDEDFAIRWVASNGLLDLGSPSVVPLLKTLAQRKPSPLFNNAARRVLSRVSASDSLRELLDDLVDSLSRETTVYESQGKALELLKRLRGDERAE
jgi:HEAT repeat protein